MARHGDGWVGAYNAWAAGLLRRKGLIEPRILEVPGRCAALEPPRADGSGEHSCYFDMMHTGPHSWVRQETDEEE